MCRVIQLPVRAERLAARPKCIPVSRPKGVWAKGLTYERQVGRILRKKWPQIVAHQWFSFRDRVGPGYCQTDFFLVRDDAVVVFECKLTETPLGWNQINLLYRPVLEAVYGKPVLGVQICKHISSGKPKVSGDASMPLAAGDFVWHLIP